MWCAVAAKGSEKVASEEITKYPLMLKSRQTKFAAGQLHWGMTDQIAQLSVRAV